MELAAGGPSTEGRRRRAGRKTAVNGGRTGHRRIEGRVHGTGGPDQIKGRARYCRRRRPDQGVRAVLAACPDQTNNAIITIFNIIHLLSKLFINSIQFNHRSGLSAGSTPPAVTRLWSRIWPRLEPHLRTLSRRKNGEVSSNKSRQGKLSWRTCCDKFMEKGVKGLLPSKNVTTREAAEALSSLSGS